LLLIVYWVAIAAERLFAVSPKPRIVIEGNERFASLQPLAAHIMTHPFIATSVAVLLLEPAPQLHDRVLLLARRLLIAGQDLIDDGLQ
jgi:hypothetical protein